MAKMKKHPSKNGVSAASVQGPKNPVPSSDLREKHFQSNNNQQYKQD